jgi:hypothetical protein
MVDACVALAADRDNNLAAARMEWIKDPHFNRQTPGIMTLVRPAPARPIWPLRSPGAAFAPAHAAASTTSSISVEASARLA